MLRLNLSQLLTILEVVIHDPLYKWSLSPVQLRARRQQQQQQQQQGGLAGAGEPFLAPLKNTAGGGGGGGGSSSQDAAQRALLRIQNKLLGYVCVLGYACPNVFILSCSVYCIAAYSQDASMMKFLYYL